ncbi:MAG: hypothetical protein ABIH76_02235 [Candidatus Bathyarchaeota archaeon]
MEIKWIRGADKISFNRPNTFFTIGIRGAGKSTFLETIGCHYLEKGHAILDLFGSRDGEGLAWLRSPIIEDKKVLLVHGENVSVKASYNCKPATKVTLSDFINYDLIISSSPLYLGVDDEFINAAQLTDKIYKRLSWKRLVFCLCREAANLFYSRLKISENQVVSKAQMTYLVREARHVGMALGLDSTRYYSIDIDIRNLSDYIILKNQGMTGLTSDLSWLYSVFEPHIIRNMPPQFFIILSKTGSIGIGEFKAIDWHKQEGENILKAVGINVEYGEPIEKGEYRGTHNTVGDVEHADIIRLYVAEGLSMNRIGEKLERSSRVPFTVIHKHNSSVEGAGFCPACRRVKSALDRKLARRK